MEYREAMVADIPGMQVVRIAVKENRLSDPSLVPNEAYPPFLTAKGKGWVCVDNGQVMGFAIVDLLEHNIWALFVAPEHEGNGIGKTLHQLMMDWYFEQTDTTVWLGTAGGTRAELFYEKQGWMRQGTVNNDEIKFVMSKELWQAAKSNRQSE